jgi:hypothetical protein
VLQRPTVSTVGDCQARGDEGFMFALFARLFAGLHRHVTR